MADKEIYSKIVLGDMLVIFIKDNRNQCVGYTLIPASLEKEIELDGWWSVEPAVQCKFTGDNYPDAFIHGHSMKNSQSSNDLKFIGIEVDGKAGDDTVKITAEYERREVRILAILEHKKGTGFIKAYSVFESFSEEKQTLEMASSFNITAFPVLGRGLRQKDLVLYRMRSKWSMEGKLERRTFLDMELEPAWLRIGAASERFGEVGSMPVRRYFPWMAASDEAFGYSIGAQLYINSSWQMEVYNRDEKNSLSGGIADREFGHWMKDIRKGERFTTPVAVITVAEGDVDLISHRLVSAQYENLLNVPESEKELPVIFNEYCTSWGNPDEQEMEKIAEKLKGHGITYCVIDAGWHVKDGNDWSDIGDWITNRNKFPGTLKKTADKIKECGMIPGLWYEMEVVGKDSDMFKNESMLLKRDGIPIQTMFRRFLDMRNPKVYEYLSERVIKNLKDNGFGYLKVDYNDNLGIGCDGAESLGEGLRQNMLSSIGFFKKIREEIPDIVIENCSSGGHRLEPSMQAVTSMASFSDAHEWQAIPVIAANVTRAILPAQSQIWAVIRSKDDTKRLHYSLSNTFLGRMCLSGDMSTISDMQFEIVDEAIKYYKKCSSIIKYGRNFRYGPYQDSYNELKGWQAVVRLSEDNKTALVVVNTFAMSGETTLEFALPPMFCECALQAPGLDKPGQESVHIDSFKREGIGIDADFRRVKISGLSDYDGLVFRIIGQGEP